MDAPLAQCTREEQRAVVRFLWSEGSSGTKIHQRLLAQYGDNALSKTMVYEWIEKFKTGRTSVKHAEGAGRPSTSTSEEKIEQAQQMILANQRITIDEVAQSLQISFGSAQEIIHEILGYNKVSARWVPRQLTEEHKRRRMEICQTLLNRYNNEGEAFLSRIVTGDESWVYHYSPETKRQSLEWKHPFPTIIFLPHSKMHYGVVNFLLMNQCKKRCINGCVTSQKLSSQMAFISL